MSEARVLPFRLRRTKRTAALRSTRPEPPSSLGSESVQSWVEVVAPDGHSTTLLMEYVSPWFPAEVIPGAPLTVRLQTPGGAEGEEWVFELLALVERWLDAVPLPCAKVRYGGRSYLFRASNGAGEFATADVELLNA